MWGRVTAHRFRPQVVLTGNSQSAHCVFQTPKIKAKMKKVTIPEDLERLLSVVGRGLDNGKVADRALADLMAALSALPADTVSRYAVHIADNARLFIHYNRPSWFQKLLRRAPVNPWQAARMPGLKYLFLFHFNGRVREIALQSIDGELESPFWFGAVCLRLNDWAEPVRNAAFLCAQRCFPVTAADIIAKGAVSLVLTQNTWERWGVERTELDAALSRPDVVEHIAKIIRERQTGPVSKILRLMMRSRAIDVHLPQLAAEARQPAVRAMAVQTIADMTAAWPSHWEWKWIDKFMGRRKKVHTFERRTVNVEVDRMDIIHAAALDNAAIVRLAALDALIKYDPFSARAAQLAHQLKNDKNHSVRMRADFLISKNGN